MVRSALHSLTTLLAMACAALVTLTCGDSNPAREYSSHTPPASTWLANSALPHGEPTYFFSTVLVLEDSSGTEVSREQTWGFATAYTIWYAQPGGDNGTEWFMLSGKLEISAANTADTTATGIASLILSRGDSVCERQGTEYTIGLRGCCTTPSLLTVTDAFDYISALNYYAGRPHLFRAAAPPVPANDIPDWMPDPDDAPIGGIGNMSD